jgi:hypothetical protein
VPGASGAVDGGLQSLAHKHEQGVEPGNREEEDLISMLVTNEITTYGWSEFTEVDERERPNFGFHWFLILRDDSSTLSLSVPSILGLVEMLSTTTLQ